MKFKKTKTSIRCKTASMPNTTLCPAREGIESGRERKVRKGMTGEKTEGEEAWKDMRSENRRGQGKMTEI